jgi:subfamily B ATP-binding cassette protein MsbA
MVDRFYRHRSFALINLDAQGGVLSRQSHERIRSFFLRAEIRWLSKQIWPLLHWHIVSFLCTTVGSVLGLLTPLILKWLIDQIIPEKNLGLLLFATALIFVAQQARTIANSIATYLMLIASQKMALTLRMRLLRHLDTLSAEYYEDTPVGTVMYPFKEPIEEISYFGSDLLPESLRMLLMTGFTLVAMAALSPQLTFAVVPLVPTFMLIRYYYRKRLAADGDQMQADRLVWSTFLQEHLSSVIPIQLLGQERRRERTGFRLLARATKSQQKLYRTGVGFALWSSLTVVCSISTVIGYGGLRVVAGNLSVGTLVAFYGFLNQVFEPLSGLAELYMRAQKAFASIRQVQLALALKPTVENPHLAISLAKDHLGEIEFARVRFGYAAQKDLLVIPSLRILPGEQVAIAGENGAGKSTLAKLAARFYDPACGSIRFGGEDIRNMHLASLRENICYLPRDPVLFDGTIGSNLRFSRPAVSDRELQEALEIVGLSEFSSTSPNKIGQRIGPGGCQLSGGERQRLAIARAILRKPRLLILDEATSCLDVSAEEPVLENIRKFLTLSTLIVISHRPSTLAVFPRVLVLSNGRIVRDDNAHFVSDDKSNWL